MHIFGDQLEFAGMDKNGELPIMPDRLKNRIRTSTYSREGCAPWLGPVRFDIVVCDLLAHVDPHVA